MSLGEITDAIPSFSFGEKSQILALETTYSYMYFVTLIFQGNSRYWGHLGEQGQPDGGFSAPPAPAAAGSCQLATPAPQVIAIWWQVKQFLCAHRLESMLAPSVRHVLL